MGVLVHVLVVELFRFQVVAQQLQMSTAATAQCRRGPVPRLPCGTVRPLGRSLRLRGGRGGSGVARRRARHAGTATAVPSSASHAPPPNASAWRAAPHSPARAPQPTPSEPTQEGCTEIQGYRAGHAVRRAFVCDAFRSASHCSSKLRQNPHSLECACCFCMARSALRRSVAGCTSPGEEQFRVRSAHSLRRP